MKENNVVKNDYIKIIFQKLRMIFYVFLYPVFQLFIKQDSNYILFLSDSREDFSGNFLYIKKELEKKDKYYINGIFKKNLKIKRNVKDSFRILYYLAKSKYVFVDDYYPLIYPIKLKKDKKLIQLWHAMGAFKTVGYSRRGTKNRFSLTHRNYTDAVVSSENVRKNYADSFGINIEKVHALGIPRTDVFFDNDYKKRIKDKLYNKYPILKTKKIILFAPTFRGSGYKDAYYNFDNIDFSELEKKYQKDYICIIKLHPLIKNKPDYDFSKSNFYIDLSCEREINNLLFITDILITDYSSVIFEYSFFKKPIIFFTPDLDEYIKERDFYYPFTKYTYGSIAKNMSELINCIKNAKIDKEKLEEFTSYFNTNCDGKSSKRVVNYFINEE